MSDKNLISIVVPVYSGEKYLEELAQEINRVREELESGEAPLEIFECIFVDDGSIDQSSMALKKITRKYSWARKISLSRNFGQHQATAAGILHTSGDWVVTMDEDLQHRPEMIIQMLRKAINESKDIIYVSPINAVHKSYFRDLSSKIFKTVFSYLTENSNVKNFNSFRLIRGSIARASASLYRADGYLDVFFSWFTQSVGIIKAEMHDSRFQETKSSGYNLSKLLTHARRLAVSSQFKILRFGLFLGFTSMISSLVYGLYVIIISSQAKHIVPGWSSLMVASLFIGGVILFILGIILEYCILMINQNGNKPAFYIIDRSKDEVLKQYFSNIMLLTDYTYDTSIQSN